MTRTRPFLVIVALSTLTLAARADDAPAKAPAVEEQGRFFEAKVRPILVEHCAKCHGDKKRKAGLRLDSRAAMLEGGDSGPAVAPGKPDESPLIAAVRYEGPNMPPSKKLAPPQVEALTQWVRMGAPWPGSDRPEASTTASGVRKGAFTITDEDRAHWAFRPLVAPAPPSVADPLWAANPIDAFIRAGLEAKGLTPNPPATKLELIRRATYDLTGLPPTPAEVDAFLADAAPNAYESLVDRLLASPRYGEKWGRHWLDLVRFAETNSYERDGPKPNAWRYRDYVIRALNQDKPYGRFVREQLAGDELPDRDADSLVATGFYRLGIWDDEPSDREQARFDGLDDLVATTGQVFLGLTIDCARCHDHKLDPIPQKDYYRLLAFFRNVNHYRNGGPTDEAPILTDAKSRADHQERVEALKRRRDELQAEIVAIEDDFRTRDAQAQGLDRVDLDGLSYRFYRDTWDRLPDFDALKAEAAGKLPRQKFDLAPRSRDDDIGFVFEGELIVPKAGRYTFDLDADDGARLTVAGKVAIDHDGVHPLGAPKSASVDLPAGRLPIRLDYFQQGGGLGLNVGWSGPGFARRSLSETGKAAAAPKDFAATLRAKGPEVLGKDRFERYQKARRELRELREAKPTTETALCVTEAGPTAPDTFVLLRGNPQNRGDKVEPAFPTVLGAPEPVLPMPAPGASTTGRRAALADWIASPTNPIAPRVMANRVWQYHFGRGIVRSPSNFGRQGEKPTHPDLLNWLAARFVADGGRLKSLHKLIMTSQAYRMSSRANPDALAKDPANDLFWRFDMRRLGAEEVRDSILAVGGVLNLKMGGPGVFPEIPAEVLAGQSVPGAGWGQSPPEEQNRRSVYVHVKRSLLMPILESFDAAETDRSSPSRFSTTQPTQALAMLNGAFLGRQAANLAGRLRREAGDDPKKQVELALKLVTARPPTAAQIERGVALIESMKAAEGARPDDALKAFCLVALNLNEFLYLD